MNGYTATASNDRRCINGRSLQKEHTDKNTTPLIVWLSHTTVHFTSFNIVIDCVKPNGGRKGARV